MIYMMQREEQFNESSDVDSEVIHPYQKEPEKKELINKEDTKSVEKPKSVPKDSIKNDTNLFYTQKPKSVDLFDPEKIDYNSDNFFGPKSPKIKLKTPEELEAPEHIKPIVPPAVGDKKEIIINSKGKSWVLSVVAGVSVFVVGGIALTNKKDPKNTYSTTSEISDIKIGDTVKINEEEKTLLKAEATTPNVNMKS